MKSSLLRRTFSVLTLSLTLSEPSAFAAKKKAPALETYAATEDQIAPGTMVPSPVEVESSVKIRTRIQPPAVKKPIVAQVQEAGIAADEGSQEAPAPFAQPKAQVVVVSKPATPSFDPVPASQVGPIAKRLKLVEELIRRHGRAYDYRQYTVKQLEEILAQLNGSDSAPTPRKASRFEAEVEARAARKIEANTSTPDLELKDLPEPVELDASQVEFDE